MTTKVFISSVLMASVLASPVAQAAAGFCGAPRPLSIPAVAVTSSKVSYRDILDRCNGLVSDLESAQRKANTIARAGSLSGAAAHLLTVLNQKFNQVRPWQESQNPHTVEAIRAAYEVAVTGFQAADESQRKLGSKLTAQVKYMMLTELYGIVLDAYYNLDVHYYGNVYSGCYGYECDGGAYNRLPYDYYNRLTDLARRFLQLQVKLGPAQADDAIELKISSAVARAAKFILLQSVYRRDFSCTIRDLHNLERDINSEICNPSMPISWYVDQVRSEMNQAANSIRRCGY